MADPTNGASGSSVDTRAAPGAMPHEVRGDPNSTETCCEEFLYPVKEPGRKRSTEPSGTDPPIRSVAGPGPAPAFSLRRPRSSPTEIRHRRWRVGIAEARTVGFSQSIFVADRPASTEPWSCVKHLCSRRPRWHPGRPRGARPTPLWDFGRSHAAAVKGRFAGLRPPLTAADYLLETPAPVLRITHVTPAPYRHLWDSRRHSILSGPRTRWREISALRSLFGMSLEAVYRGSSRSKYQCCTALRNHSSLVSG